MPVAIRAATRIQDMDDANVSLGVGVDEYALVYDHDTARFVLRAPVAAGVTDHGALTGLSDDDHAQYLLATGSRTGASAAAQLFTNGIIGPSWKPAADSTTALQLQNATGTSVLNVDTTNQKVGIGTSAPGAKLEVATDGGATNLYVTSYRNSTGQTGWSSRFARGTAAIPLIVVNGDVIGQFDFYPHNGTNFSLQTANIYTKLNGTVTSSSLPTDIIFATDAGGTAYASGKERLVILSAGNVGIGTTSPNKLFCVGSGNKFTVDTAGNILFDGTTTNHSITSKDSNHQIYFGSLSNPAYLSIATYGSLRLLSGDPGTPYETMRITAGKVGIRTSSPATALHVVGAATITDGIRPAADSTTALQLQNAAGTAQVTIDTTSGNVQLVGNTVYSSHATAVTFGRSASGPRIWFAYNDSYIYGNNVFFREAAGITDLLRCTTMGGLTITTPIRSAFAVGSSSWWLTGDTELAAIGVKTHVRAGADSNILYGLYLNPNYDANGKASVRKFGIYTVGELDNYFSGNLGIKDTAPAEALDVTGNINTTGVVKVDDVQVLSNRVIDARAADVANSGDATTDGLIDALRDAMIAHGLIAAA